MKTRLRPATLLLAIIALLLAVILAVLSGTEAHAQTPDQPGPPTEPQEPQLVAISTTGTNVLFRAWSDSVVERNFYHFPSCGGWCGWEVVPEE